MSKETIKVILKRPGEKAFTTEIPNTLEALQNEVGGYIEVTQPFEDAAIICNEEGRLLGLPPNVRYGPEFYVGPILIVGVDGEEFTDCPGDHDNVITYLNRSAEAYGLL